MVGWADVASEHGLSEFERRIDLRLEAFEHRLVARVESALRIYSVGLLSAFAVLLTLATAVTQQLS